MPAVAAGEMGSGRPLALLAGAVLLLGIADSMSAPYLVLFAVDQAHLSPLQVGLFASASGVGGIVVSSVLGRRFDRRPTRVHIVAVTLAGAIGYALLIVTRSFPLLLLLGLTLLGSVAAAFPQLFALARVVLGSGPAGQRSAPLLRSGWSLSWALGPLLGAVLLVRAGFTGIFWATAGVLVLTAAVALAVPPPVTPEREPGSADSAEPALPRLPSTVVGLLTVSVTLFFTAMIAGSLALPLFVTRELHQPATALGWLFSACAFVEVLVTLALAGLPARISQRWLIVAAMGLFVVYFVVTLLASGMGVLLAAQIARGGAIAVVGAAGIRYFQDVMAPATGRATTLFANAATAGQLVAGVLAGSSLQVLGYRPTLLLCAVIALTGTLIFALATRPRWIPAPR